MTVRILKRFWPFSVNCYSISRVNTILGPTGELTRLSSNSNIIKLRNSGTDKLNIESYH